MSYTKYGSIQITDYTSLHSIFYGLIWGTGPTNATSQGYGQTVPSVPSRFDKVIATNYWKKTVNDLATVSNHQGSTITSISPVPDTNDLVTYLANIQSNLIILANNRLNAKYQGTTSTTPLTVTGGFTSSMKSDFTITFQSADKARYFFNCGGQIYLNFSQTGGLTGDTSVKNLFNTIGDIYLSSVGESSSAVVYDNNGNLVAGSSVAPNVIIKDKTFTGITKVGGTQNNSLDVIQSGKGFYSLTTTPTIVFKTSSSAVPTLNLTITLSRTSTVITGTIEITGLPISTPTSGDTTINVSVIKPSTTYLVDTWGTQTINGKANGTTGSYLLVGGGGGGGYGSPEPYGGAGGAGGQVVSGLFISTGTFSVTVGRKGVGSIPGTPAITSAGTASVLDAPLGSLTYPTGVYVDTTTVQNRSQLYALGGSWPQNDKISLPSIVQLPNKPNYASSSGGSGKNSVNSGSITTNLLNANKGGNAGKSGEGVTSIPVSNLVRQISPSYPIFLNTYGVWYSNQTSIIPVDFTQTVNFPSTGNYTLTGCADNNYKLYISGDEVLSGNNFQIVDTKTIYLSQGSRSVRILANNIDGIGSVAITIFDNSTGKFVYGTSYSTAVGGGGGGGGGAGGAGTNGIDYTNSTSGPKGGNGGDGVASSITGTNIVYGAGGGGGGGAAINYSNDGGTSPSTGGNGGKGLGTLSVGGSVYGSDATANTGSGGGGGGGGLIATTNIASSADATSGDNSVTGNWTTSYLQKQDGTNGYFRFGSGTSTDPSEWIPLLPSLITLDNNNNPIPNVYRPDQWIVFTTANTDWTDANLKAAGIDPTKVVKASKVWISNLSCSVNSGSYYAIGAMKKSAGVGTGAFSKLVDVVLFNNTPCAEFIPPQNGQTYPFGLVKQTYPVWPGFLNTYGVWYPDIFSTTPVNYTASVYLPSNGSYKIQACADNTFSIKINSQTILTGDNFNIVYSKDVYYTRQVVSLEVYATNIGSYSGGNPGAVAVAITDLTTGILIYSTIGAPAVQITATPGLNTYSYNGKDAPTAYFPCQGNILSTPDATYTLTNDDVVFTMVRGSTSSKWGWTKGKLQMGYIPDIVVSTPIASYTIDYLVVGGGAGGGAGIIAANAGGGGGGGGGVVTGSISISGQNTFTVKVGLGGVGGTTSSVSTPGGQSSFGTIIAYGGGAEACGSTTTIGSTAGGAGKSAYACNTTSNQGFNGGNGGGYYSKSGGGGGGGGAGARGVNGSTELPPPPPPPPPWYPPAPPPAPAPVPSGGGGGCTIICTKLHELGYIPEHIYEADERFGIYLRQNDPYAYYGYIKWASVVVDWMNGQGSDFMFYIRDNEKRKKAQQSMVTRWAHRIATPWSEHMAYRMGVLEKDNRAGRLIMNMGLYISRIIGKYTNTTKPTKSIFLGYLMWIVFGIFWIIAGVK